MPDIFISNKPSENSEKIIENDPPKNEASIEAEEKEAIVASKKRNKVSLFSSFTPDPLEITYDDLDPDEVIVLFLRRHFITNLPWIAQGIGLIFVPFLLVGLFSIANISLAFISPNLSLFLTLFYYFLVIQFFFLNFLNWFYNISLVTNKKVVDIDFKILFSKHVASTKITQIEDVSMNEVGIIRSVFDYGDIKVQTAGTAGFFGFLAVPHPERIVHTIGDIMGEGENA